MDYYKLLGVKRTASTPQIKRAYRKLVLKWHPDKNPSPKAQDMFMKITEAYDVLSDPVARSRYDRRRSGNHTKPKASQAGKKQSTYSRTRNAYEEWLRTVKKQKRRTSATYKRRRYRQSNDEFTKEHAKDLGIHALGCLISLAIFVAVISLIVFLDAQFSSFPTVIIVGITSILILPLSGALFYSILDYLRKKL